MIGDKVLNPVPHSQGPVILLVEDNAADAELAVIGLQQNRPDAIVHVVSDGEGALAFLRREGTFAEVPTPDFILLDLNLPGMEGQEVLDVIKSEPELLRIPVVVFSNSNARTDVRSAYDSGANAYLLKPMEYAEIKEALGGLMDFWCDLVSLPPSSPAVAR